jgi:2-C-methyl-D-erythritol 4-phosphate cytidylyltransferase
MPLYSLLLVAMVGCLQRSMGGVEAWTLAPLSRAMRPLLTVASETSAEPVAFSWPDMAQLGLVVLAGGKGSRMKANIPKQFLCLQNDEIPILHYSLHLFLKALPAALRDASQEPPPYVILVLDPSYHAAYQDLVDQYPGKLYLAHPGVERQGSVLNGIQKLLEVDEQSRCTHVAIHDSARPLVTLEEIAAVVNDAQGAAGAVLAVPCKATIKESADHGHSVLRTIPRSRLYEVHTPQVVHIPTILAGFDYVNENNLEVTDDVSILEALGETVLLSSGQYTNLKITTPEDLNVANSILQSRQLLADERSSHPDLKFLSDKLDPAIWGSRI